jgi:integrase
VAVIRTAQEGDKAETAHCVANRITSVFNHAQDSGILEHHGAAGPTRMLVARKVKKPRASIALGDTGALRRAIDDYPDMITRLGLQPLALTFVRVGALRGMRRDELREGGAVRVLPTEGMKLRTPRVVPLSRQARALWETLRGTTGDAELVPDPSVRPGHPVSQNTSFALYRLGYRGRMTAHGFRALACTVPNGQSGFARDVIERQRAHEETGAVRWMPASR